MRIDPKTRIMYLNPVGNSDDDEMFADMARQYKNPATEVVVASMNPKTVPPRMDNLEYRAYESLIIADTVRIARHASRRNYDALVIGCFHDPALEAAREISGNTLVIGPCQASIVQALSLAGRFSVLIGEDKWEAQMRDRVRQYGYSERLASFESIGLRVADFHKDEAKTRKLLLQAARRAVQDHKAEAIILGCTLEVGFFRDLQAALKNCGQVPVIDCSIAALKAAEHAAIQKQLGWTNSRAWGMRPPPESEMARFGIFQKDYQFGNRITVPAN